MAFIHEQLSEQFFRWEMRGRGWQVFPEPVQPEPPFRPYRGNFLPIEPVPDDGLKPRIWNSLFRKLGQSLSAAPEPVETETEPEPMPLIRDALVEFQASLPADLDIARDSFEQFFRNLALCREPLVSSFWAPTNECSRSSPRARRMRHRFGDNCRPTSPTCSSGN